MMKLKKTMLKIVKLTKNCFSQPQAHYLLSSTLNLNWLHKNKHCYSEKEASKTNRGRCYCFTLKEREDTKNLSEIFW